MRKTALLIAAVVSVTLPWTVLGGSTEKEPSEDVTGLPEAVEEAIIARAAGGEIVRVVKQHDLGAFSYEAVVRTDGREWGFSVDPHGKYLYRD